MADKTVEEMARELGRNEICPDKFKYPNGAVFPCIIMGNDCARCYSEVASPTQIRAKYAELVQNGGQTDD